MNTAAVLTRPTTLEPERTIADLKETIAANEEELARVAAITNGKKGAVLRNLLDQIHSLDMDVSVKRQMTDVCLHLMEIETASRRINTELTECDAAFLSKLEKKHHGLNTRELRICLFIKLAYDTVELARMTGISTRGMESIRYRLHHKLGIGVHDSIKSYLSKLAVSG
jgi:hypothetical protein